jgi:hypothetical protein
VAESCEWQALQCDVTDAYENHVKGENEQCAADHRQLAEWLTELKEAKKLLKLALADFKAFNSDTYTCKYCKHCIAESNDCGYPDEDAACEDICGWTHEDEALKLIGND